MVYVYEYDGRDYLFTLRNTEAGELYALILSADRSCWYVVTKIEPVVARELLRGGRPYWSAVLSIHFELLYDGLRALGFQEPYFAEDCCYRFKSSHHYADMKWTLNPSGAVTTRLKDDLVVHQIVNRQL